MNSRRGATLISLMVSIAILAVALAAAASAFISAARLTKQAGHYTAASNFAQSIMEREMAQPFNSIRTGSVTDHLPNLPNAACGVTVDRPEPLLKQVTITCSWTEGRSPRTLRLCTLVAGGAR